MYEKIQAFFEKHHVSPKKESKRSFIFDCPVCGADQKLYIEKSNGRSVCFRHKEQNCPTAKTSIAKVLSMVSEVPYEQVKAELSDQIQVTPEEVIEILWEKEKQVIQHIELPLTPLTPEQLPIEPYPIDNPNSVDGLNYLLGRGLSLSTILKQYIFYSKYMKRVMFPVIQNGELYGWQGRTILKDVQPRMYNLPGEWKTKTLMFHDNLLHTDFAIVAEGAVSALKFDLVGGFVATMGKSINPRQIDLILKPHIKKVYLALDPDAINEMELLFKDIKRKRPDIDCYLIQVPAGRDDFGDCSYEECQKAFFDSVLIDTDCFVLYSYSINAI